MISPENVFINCPFDNYYFPLLKPLLFTLIYVELNPKISETSDSGEIRLNNIKNLMAISKYSIHDLSRMEPLKTKDYPRFNMPFECGIDFGLKMSNEENFGDKKFLILEKEQHRYQKVISDISGNDIKAHKNDPEQIIKVVRDWFKPTNPAIPRHKEIWLAYNEFEFDYESILNEEGYDPKDINSLTFSDIIENMAAWIPKYKKKNNIAKQPLGEIGVLVE
jgi:hypothetical protein